MKVLALLLCLCLAASVSVNGQTLTQVSNDGTYDITYTIPWALGNGDIGTANSSPWETNDPTVAYTLTKAQWAQMDFGHRVDVAGVTVRGAAWGGHMTQFRIWSQATPTSGMVDHGLFDVVTSDGTAPVNVYLRNVVQAQIIRVQPELCYQGTWCSMVASAIYDDPSVPFDCIGSLSAESSPLFDYDNDGDCETYQTYTQSVAARHGGVDCPHAHEEKIYTDVTCPDFLFSWPWEHFGTYEGQNQHTKPRWEDDGMWYGSIYGPLDMNFLEPVKLMGFEVKGTASDFITAAEIIFSDDGTTWSDKYRNPNNNDAPHEPTGLTGDTPSTMMFHETITTQFVRFDPYTCNNWCALKIRPIIDNGPEVVMGEDASGNQLKCVDGECEVFDEAAGRYVDTTSTVDDITNPLTVAKGEFQPYGSDGDMAKMEGETLIIKKTDGTFISFRQAACKN